MPSVKYPLGMFSVAVTLDLTPGTVLPAVPILLYLLGMFAKRRPLFSDCQRRISLLSFIYYHILFKVHFHFIMALRVRIWLARWSDAVVPSFPCETYWIQFSSISPQSRF